jgi:hypothetical protein
MPRRRQRPTVEIALEPGIAPRFSDVEITATGWRLADSAADYLQRSVDDGFSSLLAIANSATAVGQGASSQLAVIAGAAVGPWSVSALAQEWIPALVNLSRQVRFQILYLRRCKHCRN